ncbi:MAG: sulfatase-like hydrolase/transferase [Pseudonocardiaceae bacterium]|nr:sulfatase-like hydrolase/transferase [Pseudonocardiaceae bacterium]
MTSYRAGSAALAALLVASLAGCSTGDGRAADSGVGDSGAATSIPQGPVRQDGDRPNIVYVLTDDMDSSLLRYMPEVQRMQREGVSFSSYSVTDSLCCPSRASTLAGQFPHNTGIFTNDPPDGGFQAFHDRGGERSTIGTHLQQAGYRTGFMGKYLNGYHPRNKQGGQQPYVPPGWNEWAVAGNGYPGYNYTLNENGKLTTHGDEPRDYLTDVLARKGNKFIRQNAEARRPFFLEVSTFTPHAPATPAPRDKGAFPGLTAPRGPAFNEADMSDKPRWLRDQPALSPKQVSKIDRKYRKRAKSLQAVDDMLRRFRATLEATGQASNTHIVFNSDNGFHMGQHRLKPGKQTAFSTDTNVPLFVTGPGVSAGRVAEQQVENVDLRPTFAELAGAPPAPDVDGHSFVGPLTGKPAPGWKTASLIEHHGPNTRAGDPDRPVKGGGNPPTYSAIRTPDGTYVEYADGQREYYDRRTDPHQLTNSYSTLSATRQAALHDRLAALERCRGTDQCWAAGR